MTPATCRASRALLNWTTERLSEESGVSRATIQRWELEKGDILLQNVRKMQTAMEKAGIEFLEGPEGVGVRLKKQARLL